VQNPVSLDVPEYGDFLHKWDIKITQWWLYCNSISSWNYCFSVKKTSTLLIMF